MEIIKLYGAFTTCDEFGRLGGCKKWSKSEYIAKDASKGIGWYGGQGRVVSKDAIELNGKFYFIEDSVDVSDVDNQDELHFVKKQALSKLTKTELDALGLS